MVEGGARTGVPVVQRPSPPRKVSVHAVGAVDGVKHDHKDGEDGVVGGGLETDAVRANVKVAVVSEEAEGRGGEGAAGAGDSTSQRRLEHVEGEGGGKVGGALEAKEAKLSLGHAAPEGGRPLLGGAVKEASTPGGGSRAKETQEGCRQHHCRGCSLSVCVASVVAGVKVKEKVVTRGQLVTRRREGVLPEGHSGRREAPVVKAGVEGREARARRQQRLEVGPRLDVGKRTREAVPRRVERVKVGTVLLRELSAAEEGVPSTSAGSATQQPSCRSSQRRGGKRCAIPRWRAWREGQSRARQR